MAKVSELYSGELAVSAHYRFGDLDVTQLAYNYCIMWQSVCVGALLWYQGNI